MISPRKLLLTSALALLCGWHANAVILFRTDDPTANTTAPTRPLAGSGWQYEGRWGAFLGTPIAPQFFLSAKHIGNAGGGVFNFLGANYTVVQQFNDAFSDFVLWRVAEIFPVVAPLYTGKNEVGQRVVLIGRGTQRGAGIFVENALHGWNWGTWDGVQRWGDNIVSSIVDGGPLNQYVHATFDGSKGKTPNEGHLSSGDSGGALFIQDNGFWKLAGIHYAVDGPFYTSASGAGAFVAALFDTRGFFISDDGNPPAYNLVTGKKPVPSGFYSTRVSSKLDWIFSVTDPAGDADGSGVSNLLQYARDLNSPAPTGVGEPAVAAGDGFVTITYLKIVTNDLRYQVEQSPDQVSWTAATTQDEVVATAENIQTIQASVSNPSNEPLYLRLQISTP